jgi:hypothetical protein
MLCEHGRGCGFECRHTGHLRQCFTNWLFRNLGAFQERSSATFLLSIREACRHSGTIRIESTRIHQSSVDDWGKLLSPFAMESRASLFEQSLWRAGCLSWTIPLLSRDAVSGPGTFCYYSPGRTLHRFKIPWGPHLPWAHSFSWRGCGSRIRRTKRHDFGIRMDANANIDGQIEGKKSLICGL